MTAWALLRRMLWRWRVPVILQMNALECGAACLAMILAYFGRPMRLSECSDQLHIGRDGVSARALADVARHYGLQVKAFSLSPEGFQHVALPAIVHWNFNHFLVVERWSPATVVVVDPAIGRLTLTAAEFDAGFTGVTLTFESGVSWQRQRPRVRLSRTRYLLRTLSGGYSVIGQVVATSFVLQGVGLALPLLTKVLLDDVVPLEMSSVMGLIGIGIAVLVLCQSIIGYLRAALLLSLEARLDSRLMTGFLQHVFSLPFRFFQQRASGDLLMRLDTNASLRDAMTTQTLSAILDGALVVTYLLILAAVHPSFAALVLAVGTMEAVVLLVATPRVHQLLERELTGVAASQNYLVEVLAGIATLKASGAEERAFEHWRRLFYTHLNVSLQRSHLSNVIETILTTLRVSAPLVLLWMGTSAVLQGSMSLGTMLGLNVLAGSFLTPLSSLVSSVQQFQLVGAHVDRMIDVLEAAPEQNSASVDDKFPMTGRVELRDVGFRYDRTGPWVLRNVSFAIEPGQKIALVGRTGSGKSTLAKLLLALDVPSEGEILYDGTPVQRLNYRALRRRFGAVLQDSFLFSGSIRDNIAFNDPALPLEAVMEAASLACIHDEIAEMPMAYETRLAEAGAGLSGGQRQRVALARALAHRPAILLLDEATSHLDVATEQEVDRHLSMLSCTRVVIAHRLSTIRNADLILVLDHGTIVERGSHDELRAASGLYAALIGSQFDDHHNECLADTMPTPCAQACAHDATCAIPTRLAQFPHNDWSSR